MASFEVVGVHALNTRESNELEQQRLDEWIGETVSRHHRGGDTLGVYCQQLSLAERCVF